MTKIRLFLPFALLVCVCLIACEQDNSPSGTTVTRFGSLIKLKKEYQERYIILHRHTFPGVLNRIRKCNIRNYTIFLKEGMLFSYFEYTGNDFETDMAQMADSVTKDWWKLTDPMQEPLERRKEGEWWASCKLLYQMDTCMVNYKDAQRIALIGEIKDKQETLFKRALKTIHKSMIELFLKYSFQNLTLYTLDNRIYLYFEYVGKNYNEDMAQLLKVQEVKSLTEYLIALMKPLSRCDRFWVEMEEIFHTD